MLVGLSFHWTRCLHVGQPVPGLPIARATAFLVGVVGSLCLTTFRIKGFKKSQRKIIVT